MTRRDSGSPEALVERAFPVVANRRGTGENAASAPGAVAAGGRQSGDRCGAGVAECEFIKKDLRSGIHSGKLIARWRPSGDIGAESLPRKTSTLSGLSSLHILMRAGGGYRRSCAKRGNGSKPTAHCATWFVAGFC